MNVDRFIRKLPKGLEEDVQDGGGTLSAGEHGSGIEVTAAFRGRHCRLQVVAWYDADGRGSLNAGDWLGSSAALEVKDEGFFGGNLKRAPNVALTLQE